MKIAYFMTYDYSLKTWLDSGTLERELKIYQDIAIQNKFKYLIISYGGEEDFNLVKSFSGIEVFPIYSYFRKFENKFIRFIYSFLIALRLKKYISDIDFIKQNQLNGSWIPIILNQFLKVKLQVRTGYDTYQFALHDKKNVFIIYFYRYLTKIALNRSHIYTVTSQSDLNFLHKEFKNFSSELKITHNWTEIKDTTPLNNRYKNRILCVGRLVEQKNYKKLIYDFQELKDEFHLDIVGSGPLEEELKNIYDNTENRVNFLGNINHNSLLELYQKYRYYFIPSFYEGNPKTLIEAMGSGCICFASNIPNHKEIINHGENGFLIDVGNNNLFSELENIKNNSDLYFKIHTNAIESTQRKFGYEVIKREVIKDFSKL